MTVGPALPCPKCRRALEPLSWRDTQRGTCWSCKTDFEFLGFPALTAARAKVVPKAVLVAEHATCFYHLENQAETVCDACGRFLCTVCAIDFAGRRICPPCIAAVKKNDAQAVSERTLYDGIALGLAVLPILFGPATMVTSPVALGFVVAGWRKPRSLVTAGRTKLILAAVIALIEIAMWAFVLIVIWARKK